jgi:hypothetical protein
MSMIERVARALCRLDGHPENATMDGKPLWRDYEREARAAIGAMRSAAPVVRDRAGNVIHELRGAPEDIWAMLIDGALGEEEPQQ